MKTMALAAVALGVAGCSGGQPASFDGDDEGRDIAVQTEDSETDMRSGSGSEAGLPAGYTLYPGAEIVSNTNLSQAGRQGAILVLHTSDTPRQVIEHYRRQAEAAGVEFEPELTGPENIMLAGETPGGAAFSIGASEEEDGTVAQLIVNEAQ